MAKLLVADDERSMRELLELVFKREGHQVTAVSNGREALDAMQKVSFDLLITDVKMPDVGGIELLRAAREQAPEMMVIMMTAFRPSRMRAPPSNLGRTISFKNRLMWMSSS